MKFTLKAYQDEAVRDVLAHLEKAKRRWREDGDPQAFSLSATTGAGKTVMAAAVIEALFHGSAEYDAAPDPTATVLWFSDDPSLNAQSRYRLHEASDRLEPSRLVTVRNSFSQETFRPGHVYFLNTQKLSSNSLLVRGFDADAEGDGGLALRPDGRSHTVWETIRNTVEDPDRTLILLLDEAHRGVRGSVRGRDTIVTRLIAGQGSVPGVPVVWGISATVERFEEAIRNIDTLDRMSPVTVEAQKVQASGLLKDTLNLDVPEESVAVETVLLRRGAAKLRQFSRAWADYAEEQGASGTVKPLLVLQVPNTPDPDEIGSWLRVMQDEWPELAPDSFANVFGEHRTETFGPFEVPYVAPERVEESDWIRVPVAKDAISTGWDCPRAEVMVSFRAAADRTHITQLLGRMVRTPLARRIPGNALLNSVDCLLPRFNRRTVEQVVEALMNGVDDATGEHSSKRILINPVTLRPNPDVPEAVWGKFETLPSQGLPQRRRRPVARLYSLADALAHDGLMADAAKTATRRLHAVLDGAAVQFADKVAAERADVLRVDGATLQADLQTREKSFEAFVEAADMSVIDAYYSAAARRFGGDLTRGYADRLADRIAGEDGWEGDGIDALAEARIDIAALGLVEDVRNRLETEADRITGEWLRSHRVAVKSLSNARQDIYRSVREASPHPQPSDLVRPESTQQMTETRNSDGTVSALPRLDRHLLCDTDGTYPYRAADLNPDEEVIVRTELGRPGVTAWYRNPVRAGQESLGVVYGKDGAANIFYPDILIFTQAGDGSVFADIVDPHSAHLADALPKLRGLAAYAEEYGAHFHWIDSLANIDGKLRVLDMQEPAVRRAVGAAVSARSLFVGPDALEYTASL